MGFVTDIIGDITGSTAAAEGAQAAAGTQARAAQAGIAEQRRQFDAITEMMAPYVAAGGEALAGQQALAGLGGPAAQQQAIAQLQAGPQFQALTQQGEEAMLQQAAATGGLRGGNIQGALAQFRPQMLSQLIESQYGKLGGLTQLGQASAGMQASAGQQSAGNIANLLQQQGAATAGGQLAAGQARQQAFSNLMGLGGTAASLGMAFSDRRLKDNLEKVGSYKGLDIYKWDWNDKALEIGVNDTPIGFIAQEVADIYPHAVNMDERTRYMMVDYEAILKD
jgi:hypothetical protein